jgi:hypothetical protein
MEWDHEGQDRALNVACHICLYLLFVGLSLVVSLAWWKREGLTKIMNYYMEKSKK